VQHGEQHADVKGPVGHRSSTDLRPDPPRERSPVRIRLEVLTETSCKSAVCACTSQCRRLASGAGRFADNDVAPRAFAAIPVLPAYDLLARQRTEATSATHRPSRSGSPPRRRSGWSRRCAAAQNGPRLPPGRVPSCGDWGYGLAPIRSVSAPTVMPNRVSV
jgi:hypothetical protein